MLHLHFPETFDLESTFQCGQIFRFHPMESPQVYAGPIEDRILWIEQESPHDLLVRSSKEEGLDRIVAQFFHLDLDYTAMQQAVTIDPIMTQVVSATDGLHLLVQPLFECTVAFILSQCSNIPRITYHLRTLATRFGQSIKFRAHHFFLFPTPDDLISLSEQDYRDLGMGYRAKYLAQIIPSFTHFFNTIPIDPTLCNTALQSLPGVGQKIADCIQLFGFGRLDVFPVDRWMARFMQEHYAPQEKSHGKLAELGQAKFGRWAGYAQQLIYHYSRCHQTEEKSLF